MKAQKYSTRTFIIKKNPSTPKLVF
jgi:hypothetical protein